MTAGAGLALGTAGMLAWLGMPWWSFLAALPVGWLGFELTNRRSDAAGSLLGLVLTNIAIGVVAEPLLTATGAGWLRTMTTLVWVGCLALTAVAYTWTRVIRLPGTALAGWAVAALLLWPLWPHMPTALGLATPGWGVHVGAIAVLLYIEVYWTRALGLPRTADNAVDSACAVYLDGLQRLLSRVAQ